MEQYIQNDSTQFRNVRNEYKNISTEQLKEICIQQSFPYTNMFLTIRGCLNIGNMIRISNLCACRKVIIFGRRSYDKRSACGLQNYSDVERILGLRDIDKFGDSEFIEHLTEEDCNLDPQIFEEYIKQNNYVPVFIEQHEHSIPFTAKNIKKIFDESTTINKIPIFIYGNESYGIPKNIIEIKDHFEKSFILELDQFGVGRSHNVSNACAIVSYKIMRFFMKMNNFAK